MNKLAIFVEGQTEQIFAEKLVTEIAGAANVQIKKLKTRGSAKNMTLVEARAFDSGAEYFVLIVDCGHDRKVHADIVERYDWLVGAGYQAIIGIRDVRPHKRDDIPRLREGLRYRLKTDPISPVFVLAIMETEAWFLAEHTYFASIHAALTVDRIKTELGFDPSTDDMQLRNHPSGDLDSIYFIEQLVYDKSKANVKRTVNALDFDRVRTEIGAKFTDLQTLVDCVDRFLSPEVAT